MHTSRSWDFLGMDYRQPNGLLAKAKYGDGTIIGVIDTGVTPESASFADTGYDPPPKKWKGICQVGPSFEAISCNRKFIGARWYIDDEILSSISDNEVLSPRDVEGHGTHTASTAGGNIIHNVSFLGLAAGTVRGGAPRARLAIYKACWSGYGCSGATVLKAMDDAVYDGVDVLSLSIGGTKEDVGTLHVVANGISVVYAGGNDGPIAQTVENQSPWLVTVAATTIDRSLPVVITLGNGEKLVAQSFVLLETASQFSEIQKYTDEDTVKGKIAFCFMGEMLNNKQQTSYPDVTTAVAAKGGRAVILPLFYTETILQDDPIITDLDIPFIFFKPDIAAPGVSILAAAQIPYYKGVSYHFDSGTSMACPHVAGIIAGVALWGRATAPQPMGWWWAAGGAREIEIGRRRGDRNALTYDNNGMPIQANGRVQKIADPFDYGAGFVNPVMAADPGLIYDITASDYLKFFNCMGGLGSGDNCTTAKGSLTDLNLPSIAIPNLRTFQAMTRTVTNVGQVNAVYKAFFQAPAGVEMAVEPPVLVFNKNRRVQSFRVTFKATRKVQGDYRFGSLAWHDGGSHWVRIPIAVRIRRHDDADVVTGSHHDMLASVLGSKEVALESIVYSYRHSFSGFAARLTEAQASTIRDVISVRENQIHRLHTSRSWDFLGMDYRQPNGLLAKAKYGEDIIIGVIDTGITPESPSFADDGYGPPPSKWKGVCQVGPSFKAKSCNRKLIGARWYIDDDTLRSMSKDEILSPRDVVGHGTHTASTAGGNIIHNASILGLAAGTVRGGAPRARVAMYKTCWNGVGCSAAGQLKAIDDAIHDGVDILSLSLGGPFEDPGTLHVVAKGIPVVYSAGNDGPIAQTVENSSPWLLTVAAATMDRSFPVVITLGNNDNAENIHNTVKGKIVFCFFGTKFDSERDYYNITKATSEKGGIGVILPKYNTDTLLGDTLLTLPIPLVAVDYEITYRIYQYIKENDGTPKVKISLTQTTIGKVSAPKVAAFSSRGPSYIYPGVLKPDIAAPGVTVLAAAPKAFMDAGIPYRFDSGTSMSCPHVSGIIAVLKSLHPQWSPAALKSAIMTTALTYDNNGMPIQANGKVPKIADPFDYGAGVVNPNMAADPGLIYDIEPSDYFKFFNCMGGLGSADNCTTVKGSLADLNLPSIAIPNLRTFQATTRTVTNVGQANARYKAFLYTPAGVEMTVDPPVLVFSKEKKVQSFKVTIKATGRPIQGDYSFGSLVWHDGGIHWVRIPIAVRIVIEEIYSKIS
uniref:Subtilisin-like protease n=1 Tax=Oryza rufipogon TaxID=4529 RepID=A0A0E0P4P0_ORYRU